MCSFVVRLVVARKRARTYTLKMPRFNALILKFVTKIAQCSLFGVCHDNWLCIQGDYGNPHNIPRCVRFGCCRLFEHSSHIIGREPIREIIFNWLTCGFCLAISLMMFVISISIFVDIFVIAFGFRAFLGDNDTHLSVWCAFNLLFASVRSFVFVAVPHWRIILSTFH